MVSGEGKPPKPAESSRLNFKLLLSPCAESHDAEHVPKVIEVLLRRGIEVVPQLEHVVREEAYEEH